MIQATFTTGVPSATVHGLHQWDRGRKLQIIAEGLPAAFEVHFECPGMKEAEVRLTETVDGVPTVCIPDRCLKQPAPIKAWVYVTDDTSGRTELSVTLVVTPRLAPPDTSTPEQEDEAADKYDQLFALMSEAYDAIEACKNVEANADEAQAAADEAKGYKDSASMSALSASSYVTQVKAHASAAATAEEGALEARAQAEAFALQAKRSAEETKNVLPEYTSTNIKPYYLSDNIQETYSTTASSETWGSLYCKKNGQIFLVELRETGSATTLGVVRWNGQGHQYTPAVSFPRVNNYHAFVRLHLKPHENNTEYIDEHSGETFLVGRYRMEYCLQYENGSSTAWAPFTDVNVTIILRPLTPTLTQY